MTIVALQTLTADFDTQARMDFGPFIHRSGRAFLYYLEVLDLADAAPRTYLNVNTRFANGGDNIRSPLICKFFPTQTKMGFLLKVPRIRDTNNQQILVQCGPKEFFPNSTVQRQMQVQLSWEDDTEYRLDDSWPN